MVPVKRNPETDGRHWSLDRRVPVAFVLVILAQIGLGIWAVAKMDSSITANREAIKLTEKRVDRLEDGNASVISRLVRMETLLERIDKRLDQNERR